MLRALLWGIVTVGSWRDVGVMNYPEIMRVDYHSVVVESFAGKCCATTNSKRQVLPRYIAVHLLHRHLSEMAVSRNL
jgi:hypothetical protein